MLCVDAHVHLWDEAHTPQPWMTPEVEEIARPFGPADLRPLLDRNGVDAVVLVQGACLDSDTDYLLAEAERQPWIAAVTAWLRLDEPATARTRLDELRAHPKFRAVRHLVHDEEDVHWVVRERVLESVALLDAAGVVFEIPVVYPNHFDDVVELAERFSEPFDRRRPSRKAAARKREPRRLDIEAPRLRGTAERPREALGPEHDARTFGLGRGRLRAGGFGRARAVRAGTAHVRQRLAGRAPERRLRPRLARDAPPRRAARSRPRSGTARRQCRTALSILGERRMTR